MAAVQWEGASSGGRVLLGDEMEKRRVGREGCAQLHGETVYCNSSSHVIVEEGTWYCRPTTLHPIGCFAFR